MNSFIIPTYAIYLFVTIGLTIWVAKALFKNGKIFLIDIFHGNTALADSVNNLLLVGFYLINIGYVVYTLQTHTNVSSPTIMIEELSVKIGFIILVLGVMHFLNLFVFFRLRKKAQISHQQIQL